MKEVDNLIPVDPLSNDPRVQQAKTLLLEAISERQSGIKGLSPPDPKKKIEYHKLLEAFKEARGAPLWHPYIGSGVGRGALVELLDGSVKYDLISGIGPHYFGHSHRIYMEACVDAALSDTVMEGHLQQNVDTLALMRQLIGLSGMDHCFLSSTGVMANENALKICFQKRFPANRLLAFEHCFMGRTLAASQITDKAQFREGLPQTLFVDYIPYYDYQDPEGSAEKTLNVLYNYLKRHPNQFAAMAFELVQGEGGFYSGTRDYFRAIMEVLRSEGIMIIVDEVQTFGRTPQLFAMQYFGVEDLADIVTIGKLSHVCATLFKKNVAPKPGLLSQTFISSTSAIRASIAIITELTKGGYYGPHGLIEKLHLKFQDILFKLSEKYPHLIQGPFGVGAMVGFSVYKGDPEKTVAFVKALFDAGVIAFTAGSMPMRVRFLPPIAVLDDNDYTIIGNVLEEVLLDKQ